MYMASRFVWSWFKTSYDSVQGGDSEGAAKAWGNVWKTCHDRWDRRSTAHHRRSLLSSSEIRALSSPWILFLICASFFALSSPRSHDIVLYLDPPFIWIPPIDPFKTRLPEDYCNIDLKELEILLCSLHIYFWIAWTRDGSTCHFWEFVTNCRIHLS